MKIKYLSLIIGSILLGSSTFFLFPGITKDALEPKIVGALASATALVQLATVWFFLTSLKAFKQRLRNAYYTLVAGILFFSAAQLLLLVSFFAKFDDALRSLLIVAFYALGSFIMYVAIYKLSKLLSIRNLWNSRLFVAGLVLTLSVATSFLPHEDWADSAVILAIIFGSVTLSATFAAAAGVLSLRIRQTLGHDYQAPMLWLGLGFFSLAFAHYQEMIIKVTGFLGDSWYVTYGWNTFPEYIAGVLFLGAGLAFQATSQETGALAENASYLDVINYMTQLVSSPKDIDVTLDKVRQITAVQSSSAALSAADQKTLLSVYGEIETYLTTKEPLRKLTREDLRKRLPASFLQALAK